MAQGDGVSSKNYWHLKEAKYQKKKKKTFPIYQYFISCHAQALLLLVLFSSKMKYVMLSCFSPSFRVCLSHLLCQRQRLEGPVRPPWAEDSTRGKYSFVEDFQFFFCVLALKGLRCDSCINNYFKILKRSVFEEFMGIIVYWWGFG